VCAALHSRLRLTARGSKSPDTLPSQLVETQNVSMDRYTSQRYWSLFENGILTPIYQRGDVNGLQAIRPCGSLITSFIVAATQALWFPSCGSELILLGLSNVTPVSLVGDGEQLKSARYWSFLDLPSNSLENSRFEKRSKLLRLLRTVVVKEEGSC
jgi:hypothetical protein